MPLQIQCQWDSLSHDDDVLRTELSHLSATSTASGRNTGGYDSCNTPTNLTVFMGVCAALAFALIIAGLTHTGQMAVRCAALAYTAFPHTQ